MTDRHRAQFPVRLGAGLLEKVDLAAAHDEQSRNAWIIAAIEAALADSPSVRVCLQEVLADRRPVVLRLDPGLLRQVDAHREDRRMSRTAWLIEALVRSLDDYEFE
jgi:hypothetical protein